MRSSSAVTSPSAIAFSGKDDHAALEGALYIRTVVDARRAVDKRFGSGRGRNAARTLDVSGLTSLDTTGSLFLRDLQQRNVKLTGVRDEHRALLDLIAGLDGKPLPKPDVPSR